MARKKASTTAKSKSKAVNFTDEKAINELDVKHELTEKQEEIRNNIMKKFGLIKDENGKIIDSKHTVENVNFKPMPDNSLQVIKKHAKGHTPFQSVVNLRADDILLFLNDLDGFKDLMEKEQERHFIVKDENGNEKEEKYYVSAECRNPSQIRIMGTLEEVQTMINALLDPLELREKVFYTDNHGNQKMRTGIIGLSKLECNKHNRNSTYCKDTIRGYINLYKVNNQPSQTACKRYISYEKDQSPVLDATFVSENLEQIKLMDEKDNKEKLYMAVGKITKEQQQNPQIAKILNDMKNQPDQKLLNPHDFSVLESYIKDKNNKKIEKTTYWNTGDIIIYKDFPMNTVYDDRDYKIEKEKAIEEKNARITFI